MPEIVDDDNTLLLDEVAEQKERLAISIEDLDRLPTEMRMKLRLSWVLDKTGTVKAGRDDKPAVVFTCDLLQAALICDIIRNQDRHAKERVLTAVYICRESHWLRVQDVTPLTLCDSQGKSRLNPKVFRIDPSSVIGIAPPRRRVEF